MTTEFKLGDRVRGATHVTYSPHRRIYEGVLRTAGTLTAALDTDNEGLQYVYTETLQAVDPYAPKVGDKVRVFDTYEGVVTHVDSSTVTIENRYSLDLGAPREPIAGVRTRTLELLEKAPEPVKEFAVGTVVAGGGFAPMGRTQKGQWVNIQSGTVTVYADPSIRRFIERGPLAIVHEPPTS